MATLREEDAWVSPIYRIERNDPLMGGEFGISNLQARQLASRTRYLYERLKESHGAPTPKNYTIEKLVFLS